MLKISHRVGHALTTSGKESPDKVKEWAQAEPIAKLVIGKLSHYKGIAQQRFDDPAGIIDKHVNQLVQEVNDWGSHVHIDYHLNAHGDGTEWTTGNGTEVFVKTRVPKDAVNLAQKVVDNITRVTGFSNRGVKYYDWAMVAGPKGTNILIEICFMTNKNDVAVVRSKEGQENIADAIVNAVVSQYGLELATPITEKEVGELPLKVGDRGEGVKIVHQQLAALGYIMQVDKDRDIYDDFTAGKVKQFQQDQQIRTQNGVYDYYTARAFAQVMEVYRNHWLKTSGQ